MAPETPLTLLFAGFSSPSAPGAMFNFRETPVATFPVGIPVVRLAPAAAPESLFVPEPMLDVLPVAPTPDVLPLAP